MNKTMKTTLIAGVITFTAMTTVTANAAWQGPRGDCNMMQERGMPAGTMKPRGRMGMMMDRELDLTAAEAKTLVQARLIMQGNDRLKAGQVTEKDENTYLVDIVTLDDSLVRQVEVDRDNGLPRGPRMTKR